MPGLPLNPLDFARYKEMPHGSITWDISLFGRVACPEMPHRYGCKDVPKCPTGYGRELSLYGRQIGRMTKRCFLRLLQEIVTHPANSPSPRHSMCHSLVGDEAPRMVVMRSLSAPSRQFVGVATIMTSELVASSVPNAAVIDSAARVGPRLPASEKMMT